MDRFKFRVWDKERKCFFNDDEVVIYPDGEESFFNADYDFTECVVEQCTGLKDKNNKLIYEGDIVTDGFNTFVVEWYKEMAQFVARFRDEKHLYTVFYPDDANTKYEVLGNIHEGKKKHAK